MATSTTEDGDAEQHDLEKEISKLRLSKKELFEKAKPINEELERVAQRERECVDRLHRITAEKHESEKHRQTVQRLVELEAEIERLKCEISRLKCEKVAFTDKSNKLRQSLDQAAKYSKTETEDTRT